MAGQRETRRFVAYLLVALLVLWLLEFGLGLGFAP